MIQKIIQILPYLLHPLLVPTYLNAILILNMPELYEPISNNNLPYLLLTIFLTTFFIPLLSITSLRLTSVIQNFSLKSHKERFVPFLFITIFYGITTYFLIDKFHINGTIASIFIVFCMLSLLLTILLFISKFSAHTISYCAAPGIIFGLARHYPGYDLLYPLILLIIMCGLIMTSRLYFQRYDVNEITLSAFLGSLVGYLGMILI